VGVERIGCEVQGSAVPKPSREPSEHIPEELVSRSERSGQEYGPYTSGTDTTESILVHFQDEDGSTE